MVKMMLDLPEGLHRVLAIEAAIHEMTLEEVATECIKDQIEAHMQMPETIHSWIKDIYERRKAE